MARAEATPSPPMPSKTTAKNKTKAISERTIIAITADVLEIAWIMKGKTTRVTKAIKVGRSALSRQLQTPDPNPGRPTGESFVEELVFPDKAWPCRDFHERGGCARTCCVKARPEGSPLLSMIKYIDNATAAIDVSVYCFRCKPLQWALLRAKSAERGVVIRILTDGGQAGVRGSQIDLLTATTSQFVFPAVQCITNFSTNNNSHEPQKQQRMMKVVPVRIGPKYQADLPELLSPDQSGKSVANAATSAGDDTPAPPLPLVPAPAAALSPPPRYKQRWTPSRFTSEEVTEFLRSVCRLNEVETVRVPPAVGLQCLFESDFQVPTAVELLVAARRRKARKQCAEDEHLSDAAFGSAVGTHGKKFFLIQQQLEHVTTGDVIRRFYLWKTSAAYARWRERIKARRNKESARLRAWGDLEDSETSDFHNEYCELCFTGGQLLCCDGCERAYHFSCVTPPINEIPNGDWFCSHCSNILETSLRVKQSDENEHCDEVVVDESIGEASDVETLDLEDIDDDEDDETLSAVGTTSSRTKDAQSGSFGSERLSPMRTASSTDNDESDSGFKSASASSDGRFSSLTIKQENISSADAGEAAFKVKKEPPHFPTSASGKAPASQQQRRATELRKFVSPAKTALVLEPSSSERKRKRKIEAPRRIPQQ